MKRIFIIILLSHTAIPVFSQRNSSGLLTGTVIDENKKAVSAASILLQAYTDSLSYKATLTDKNGFFSFQDIALGYYKLTISFIGFQTLTIDSIHFRKERYDFNLNDITLKNQTIPNLNEVIVYAEKPLIESKDGNITFHAGESALAAGSTAGELLNNVPLVSKDPNGKILVRGKEPKILIDDKPVELNLQQLQDLLESLPGSSIEKIEVLTNPPPQYANEQGGVINIVTRKGKIGMGGRLSVSAGTRGEGNLNGNFSYRKNKFSLNINGGAGMNRFNGYGNSVRENSYGDSINYFKTQNNFLNRNTRPHFRLTLDYDASRYRSLHAEFTFNQNDFNNRNTTGYTHINRLDEIYKLSERTIRSNGKNINPAASITYTLKSKRAGEQLRLLAGGNFSINRNDRLFYQQFFNPDYSFNGIDSTQKQETDNQSNGYHIRISYDRPLIEKKTFFAAGGAYNRNNNTVLVNASYLKKPEGLFSSLDLLNQHFRFHQGISNLRTSLKQMLGGNLSITTGLAVEETRIAFDLLKEGRAVTNRYWNFLPFANLNKNWNDNLNLTFSYRRTIRRPGINELNPTVDFSDPYNIRFGNYELRPSLAHNLDLVVGKTRPKYFLNFGLGYNKVEAIFSSIRTLLSDGKTQISWENISYRREYELSTWNGFTIEKKIKLNLSASYTYNQYSPYDKTVRKYRDGGSFTATLSGNYAIKDLWNFNGNFTTNRFANPQGAVSWNLSMHIGIQRKLFNKKLIVTFNFIDPFRNQIVNSYTFGKNFIVHSSSTTQTKNYRLTMAYNFTKTANKIGLPKNK